jgi:hypothetical protein
MNQAIEIKTASETRDRIAIAIVMTDEPLPSRIDEAAEVIGIPPAELIALLNEPGFIKTLRALTRAQASLALHGRGIRRLTEILAGGEDKDSLAALQLLGKLSGDLRAGQSVDVRVSFEELRARLDVNCSPHHDMFEVRDAPVMDADFVDENDSDTN